MSLESTELMPSIGSVERLDSILWGSAELPPPFRPCLRTDARATLDDLVLGGIIVFSALRAALALEVAMDADSYYKLATSLMELVGVRCNPAWRAHLSAEASRGRVVYKLSPELIASLYSPSPLEPGSVTSKVGNPEYMAYAAVVRSALERLAWKRPELRPPGLLRSSVEMWLLYLAAEAGRKAGAAWQARALLSNILYMVALRGKGLEPDVFNNIMEILAAHAESGCTTATHRLLDLVESVSVTRKRSIRAIYHLIGLLSTDTGRLLAEKLAWLIHALPEPEAHTVIREIMSRARDLSPEVRDILGPALLHRVLPAERGGELRSLYPALELADALFAPGVALALERIYVAGSSSDKIRENILNLFLNKLFEENEWERQVSLDSLQRLVPKFLKNKYLCKIIIKILKQHPIDYYAARLMETLANTIVSISHKEISWKCQRGIRDLINHLLEELERRNEGVDPRTAYILKKIVSIEDYYLNKLIYNLEKKRKNTDLLNDLKWADNLLRDNRKILEILEEKISRMLLGEERALWTVMDIAIISRNSEITKKAIDALAEEASSHELKALWALRTIGLDKPTYIEYIINKIIKIIKQYSYEKDEFMGEAQYTLMTLAWTGVLWNLISPEMEREIIDALENAASLTGLVHLYFVFLNNKDKIIYSLSKVLSRPAEEIWGNPSEVIVLNNDKIKLLIKNIINYYKRLKQTARPSWTELLPLSKETRLIIIEKIKDIIINNIELLEVISYYMRRTPETSIYIEKLINKEIIENNEKILEILVKIFPEISLNNDEIVRKVLQSDRELKKLVVRSIIRIGKIPLTLRYALEAECGNRAFGEPLNAIRELLDGDLCALLVVFDRLLTPASRSYDGMPLLWLLTQ